MPFLGSCLPGCDRGRRPPRQRVPPRHAGRRPQHSSAPHSFGLVARWWTPTTEGCVETSPNGFANQHRNPPCCKLGPQYGRDQYFLSRQSIDCVNVRFRDGETQLSASRAFLGRGPRGRRHPGQSEAARVPADGQRPGTDAGEVTGAKAVRSFGPRPCPAHLGQTIYRYADQVFGLGRDLKPTLAGGSARNRTRVSQQPARRA